ncbi:putative replication protein RepA4, partial [Escherichia coli EC1850]
MDFTLPPPPALPDHTR